MFMVRRLAFIASAMGLLEEHLVLQLEVQIFFCMLTLCLFYSKAWTYQSIYDRRIELFNEITVLVIWVTMMMFSNFIEKGETRYKVGYAFVFVSIGNISVHVALLFYTLGKKLKQSCKKRQAKKKAQTLNQQRKTKKETEL